MMAGEYDRPENLNYSALNFNHVAGTTDVFDITVVTEQGDIQIIRRHLISHQGIKRRSNNLLNVNARFECIKRTDVPWSRSISKPFHFVGEPQTAFEHNASVFKFQFVGLAILAGILIVGSLFGAADPRPRKVGSFQFVAISAALVFFVSSICVFIYGLMPWHATEQLVDYYQFFDALPRGTKGLLPLTAEQLGRLVAGPPHPDSTEASVSVFAWTTSGLTALWLAVNSNCIAAGLYSRCISHAPVQSWQKVLAEGEAPTAQETLSAMEQSLAGKSAWKLKIIQAKATAFAQQCSTDSSQQERSDAMSGKETALVPSNRSEPVFDIQGRVREASNIRSHWSAWRFETEASAAVIAMEAQAKHARAVVACIDEHTQAMAAMNRFFDAALEMQVRRDLTNENYENQASDERDRFSESVHKRALAGKRRDREQLVADRDTLAAKHGLQAERVFKREKFALGQKRIESRIAEAHVGVAVARNAAGDSSGSTPVENEPTEATFLTLLIARKQKELAEAEADGKDTAGLRLQLDELKKLLELL